MISKGDVHNRIIHVVAPKNTVQFISGSAPITTKMLANPPKPGKVSYNLGKYEATAKGVISRHKARIIPLEK